MSYDDYMGLLDMIDDEPVSDKTAHIALVIIVVAILALAQCAVGYAAEIGKVCRYENITYFNFKEFPDDYRFTVEEMIYSSNHDKGKFGVEGYPKFEGENVVFENKDKRPVYMLIVKKERFICEKK